MGNTQPEMENYNNLMQTALDELKKFPEIPLPFYNKKFDTQTLAVKLRNNPKYLSEEIGYHGNFGNYIPLFLY